MIDLCVIAHSAGAADMAARCYPKRTLTTVQFKEMAIAAGGVSRTYHQFMGLN